MLPQQTPGIVEPYPFCVDIKELSSVGGAIYLYFLFMKFIIVLYLISIAVCSIPQILKLQDINKDLEVFCSSNNNKVYGRNPENNNFVISLNSTNSTTSISNSILNQTNNNSISTIILNCSEYLTSVNDFTTRFNIDNYSKYLILILILMFIHILYYRKV